MKRTQTAIAGQIGISMPFLNNILNGRRRPSWKTALKLAELTGIDVKDLMNDPGGTLQRWFDEQPEAAA